MKPAASRHSELGELAAFLGRADPWFESIVNTLCPAIHKLAEMPLSLDTSQTVDPFILDVITYYVRMGAQPIYFQIYMVKIFFSDLSQDPVEDIFLTELKVKMQDSKFPKEGCSPRRRGVAEGPGAELFICYQKALLSHRAREVTVSLRATGLVLKALPDSGTEVSGPTHWSPAAAPLTDHMCLNVSVTEVIKSSNLAGRSFSTVTNTFRTANIQIQSQDQKLLTLTLDKDGQRTFKDVVRRREPSYRTGKALSLVGGDARLILLALTVLLIGAATSAVQNFLFWHMKDHGSSELVMGFSVALGLLGEILLHPFKTPLLRKLSKVGTVGLGLGCLAGQLLYYSFLWSWWSVLPVQIFSAISHGALWWAVGASIEDLATPGTERPLHAMFRGHFYGGGASLGSFVGGFVGMRFGLAVLYQACCVVLWLWLALFLSIRPRLPRERKINYSKLLAVEASDTSDSEQGTERDWLVKAMRDEPSD